MYQRFLFIINKENLFFLIKCEFTDWKYITCCFERSRSKTICKKAVNILCRYLQEFQPLGTAGGIYHFRDQIAMGEPEAFLVLNADIMGDYPLLEFVEFHRKHAGEHSILATEVRRVVLILLLKLYLSYVGSVAALWLVHLTPDAAVQVRALARKVVMSSWARHIPLAVPLSTQVYKWVRANLMLWVTMR